ncbi:MAG TPA: prolipoprotein diacylglyceryl transferase family protein, partial [Chryseolinea sp.]|nr:prolipoprotein diacylglyceryl transferase family protein [Chryseolinea sp.]
MISFILWNVSPVAFGAGPLIVRWYALFFIIGFIAGRQLLISLYKKEGKPSAEIELLILYIVCAAIVVSRIIYVLSYDPRLITTQPAEVFLPVAFKPTFHFSGITELSGHGGMIGLMIGLWFFWRRSRKETYMRMLDRLSIGVALVATLFCMGYFMNSENPGRVTNLPWGTISMRPITDGLVKIPCCMMRNPGGANPLQSVTVRKDTSRVLDVEGQRPLILYLFFKPGATEQSVNEFLIGDVKTFLFDNSNAMYEPGDQPLHYTIFQEKIDVFTARIRAIGISRHPIYAYEALIFLFLFLWLMAYRKKLNYVIPEGRIAGMFFLIGWSMMFVTGFLHEPGATYENSMMLNTGQLLSIPFM